MITKISLYTSDSFNPYENLAKEKYLLDNVSDTELILYLWQNQNTVVIGRNQNPWTECNCKLLEEEGGHLARRLSGGGAVFHDLGNLNFTFICPSENYDLSRHMEVIRLSCRKAGIETEPSGRNDILADGRKFSGNAFYNSKGRSYHHGTIMINSDIEKLQRYLTPTKAKLEAKGVKSVRSRVVNLSELNPELSCDVMKRYMAEAFEEIYGLTSSVPTNTDSAQISTLAEKYSAWDYLYGSQPPFTFSCEKRFDWGSIDIRLNVEKGKITSAICYTDSMDWKLGEDVQLSLCGCRFEADDIKASLANTLKKEIFEDISSLICKTI